MSTYGKGGCHIKIWAIKHVPTLYVWRIYSYRFYEGLWEGPLPLRRRRHAENGSVLVTAATRASVTIAVLRRMDGLDELV